MKQNTRSFMTSGTQVDSLSSKSPRITPRLNTTSELTTTSSTMTLSSSRRWGIMETLKRAMEIIMELCTTERHINAQLRNLMEVRGLDTVSFSSDDK